MPPRSTLSFNLSVQPHDKYPTSLNPPSLLVNVLMFKVESWSNQTFQSLIWSQTLFIWAIPSFSTIMILPKLIIYFSKFKTKLSTIKAHKVNHDGRLIYINSILASIPIYYMSTILLSKTFISKITSIIIIFGGLG
jgi:hypothetical protein